ncbi:MAG: cbb3-type cytochrome oxidase assembly protein CcoS [Pseudomonadota bacterium]|nr:cbb3-type cytochrome oxidase assembly protein CcoS [Pseudomonadota bacterium]
MEALFLLIPLSLCLVALAIWLFFGAADSGQFDDLEGPAQHVLQDDDRAGQAAAQGVQRSDLGQTTDRPES